MNKAEKYLLRSEILLIRESLVDGQPTITSKRLIDNLLEVIKTKL